MGRTRGTYALRSLNIRALQDNPYRSREYKEEDGSLPPQVCSQNRLRIQNTHLRQAL